MKTVGYVCSFIGSEVACAAQKAMIERYCKYHNIECTEFFCDLKELKRTIANAAQMRSVGYAHAYKSERYFPAYDQMIAEIMGGNIKRILVDSLGRLRACKHIRDFFENICTHYNVEIVEVCGHLEEQRQTDASRVAIYHFTDKSNEKPRVYTKSVDTLYEFVSQQKCWGTPYLYQDFSLKKSEHKAYEQFAKNTSDYDVLVTSDFYHIEDKLGTFFKEIVSLENMGVSVESMKDGRIKWTTGQFLARNLKVAIYDRWLDDSDRELELERINAFVKYKTAWNIADIYIEENKVETDSKQIELQNLIKNIEKYDAVLVRKFNVLHWRTSMFFKVAKILNTPIYSMKEGGMYLERQDL